MGRIDTHQIRSYGAYQSYDEEEDHSSDLVVWKSLLSFEVHQRILKQRVILPAIIEKHNSLFSRCTLSRTLDEMDVSE